MRCARFSVFLGVAAVFANPILRDGFSLINERQWFDDQTTDEYDEQWLSTGISSGSLSNNPSARTSTESLPNNFLVADHPASGSDDLPDMSFADMPFGSVQSPSAAEPNPIVGLSDPSTVADCGSANTLSSKRDSLAENPKSCPNSAIPLREAIPITNIPRKRKNSAIRRPSKSQEESRPPSSSPEYHLCKDISARLDLEIEFPLFLVSCGGPLVGNLDRPDVIFNCVLGKYLHSIDY